MANAYCLWRRSKSPMQSNLPPRPFFSLPPQSHSPSSYICSAELPHYVSHSTPLLSLRGQCKFILSCIKQREASRSFCPAATSLSLGIAISLFLYLSHFSFPRLKRYLCHTNRISPLYALAYISILPSSTEYHPSRFVAVSMTMA